jgi:hypothetical protein
LQYLEGVEEHSEGGGGVIIMTLKTFDIGPEKIFCLASEE